MLRCSIAAGYFAEAEQVPLLKDKDRHPLNFDGSQSESRQLVLRLRHETGMNGIEETISKRSFPWVEKQLPKSLKYDESLGVIELIGECNRARIPVDIGALLPSQIGRLATTEIAEDGKTSTECSHRCGWAAQRCESQSVGASVAQKTVNGLVQHLCNEGASKSEQSQLFTKLEKALPNLDNLPCLPISRRTQSQLIEKCQTWRHLTALLDSGLISNGLMSDVVSAMERIQNGFAQTIESLLRNKQLLVDEASTIRMLRLAFSSVDTAECVLRLLLRLPFSNAELGRQIGRLLNDEQLTILMQTLHAIIMQPHSDTNDEEKVMEASIEWLVTILDSQATRIIADTVLAEQLSSFIDYCTDMSFLLTSYGNLASVLEERQRKKEQDIIVSDYYIENILLKFPL